MIKRVLVTAFEPWGEHPFNSSEVAVGPLHGQTVRGAYIGLTSITVDGSLSALNLPVKTGALVESVQQGTPAQKHTFNPCQRLRCLGSARAQGGYRLIVPNLIDERAVIDP